MLQLSSIILILITHFVADFVLQSDKMALNKSKSNYWLTIHVFCYYGIFNFIFWVFVGGKSILIWALVNGVLHWITDYLTSRWTSYLWSKQKRHAFFVVIGFDQLIHYSCLVLTYEKIVN